MSVDNLEVRYLIQARLLGQDKEGKKRGRVSMADVVYRLHSTLMRILLQFCVQACMDWFDFNSCPMISFTVFV